MSAEELYNLGRSIGEVAHARPDITHQILVGIRDETAAGPIPNGYGFGELFEYLWRWWYHHLHSPETKPPIPFDRHARPSGIGPVSQ